MAFSKLGEDLTYECLIRVPASNHPTLAISSRSLSAAVSKPYLFAERSRLSRTEGTVYLCLADAVPNNPNPVWFVLGKKPESRTVSSGYWLMKVPMAEPSSFPASKSIASSQSTIYMIGGNHVLGDEVSTLSGLNCVTKTWSETGEMNLHRTHMDRIKICDVNGDIFVVGGSHGDGLFPELLDKKNKTWTLVSDPGIGNGARVVLVGSLDQEKLQIWSWNDGMGLQSSMDVETLLWDNTLCEGLTPFSLEGSYGHTIIVGSFIVRTIGRLITYYEENLKTMITVGGFSRLPHRPLLLLHSNGKLLCFWTRGSQVWCCEVVLERRDNRVYAMEIWTDVVLRAKAKVVFLAGTSVNH